MLTELIGYMAASLTTLCFVPQAVRVLRTRDTRAISLWMYILFSLGVLCWLAYGILLGSKPIIIANAVTLLLSLTILGMKLQEGKAMSFKDTATPLDSTPPDDR